MITESVETALSALDAILAPNSLSNLQEQIIWHCWESQTYTQIAQATG